MRSRFLQLIAALGLLLQGASARAAGPDPAGDAYATAKGSYAALKVASEEKRKFRHTWQEAIDRFKAVADKYPKSYVADDALYMAGTLYYELYDISRLRSDLDQAVTQFRALSTRFPGSNYADDALFWEAKSLHLLGRHDQEVTALLAIVEKHSNGDMIKDARRQLAKVVEDGEAPRKAAAIAAATAVATPATTSPTAQPVTTATAVAVQTPVTRSGGEASPEAQQLSGVRHWSNEGYTRVALYTGGPVKWSVNELKAEGDKPPRIYLDLTPAFVGEAVKKEGAKLADSWEIPIGDGLLTRARVAQFGPETVRVVLDVASMEKYSVFNLDDPFRILVDVNAAKDATPPLVATAAEPKTLPTAAPGETPEQRAERMAKSQAKGGISLIEQLGLKVGKIYVDAGHGGEDPGAIGPGKVREKDVTLALAKKLKVKLTELGYNAVLTRADDTFLALEERSGIANEGKGDLFVSIHCNSHDPKSKQVPSGVETYFANVASDAASARLSALENATTEKTISGLQEVLENMARNEYQLASAELATNVQNALFAEARKSNAATRNHGVKSALFFVLLTSRMPAVLVETGFISNPKDEARLKDAKYQQKLADSIAHGIDAYLNARVGVGPIAGSGKH